MPARPVPETRGPETRGPETRGPTTSATWALKEWGAVAHALLAGRQTLLLRKGGIHEKRFTAQASRFVLFPTVAHSHADAVRTEHRDLLVPGAEDCTPERVVVRAVVEVIDVVAVQRPERLEEVAQHHIWTQDSVQATRVDFRPRHLLTAIVVRTTQLRTPLVVPRRPEHGGCTSWLELDLGGVSVGPGPGGTPAVDLRGGDPSGGDLGGGDQVVDEDRLAQVAEQVRRRVG